MRGRSTGKPSVFDSACPMRPFASSPDAATGRSASGIGAEVGTVRRDADGLKATEPTGELLISMPDDWPAARVVAATAETLTANRPDDALHLAAPEGDGDGLHSGTGGIPNGRRHPDRRRDPGGVGCVCCVRQFQRSTKATSGETVPYVIDRQPYLMQLGNAQTAVVRALFDSLPCHGWTSCVVEYRSTVSTAESLVTLTDSTGASNVVRSPIEMIMAFMNLRGLMASQGRGAWLSATLIATLDGKCVFDYNHDARPDWMVQPTDESYIADLEKFPRPAELIPTWYPRRIVG